MEIGPDNCDNGIDPEIYLIEGTPVSTGLPVSPYNIAAGTNFDDNFERKPTLNIVHGMPFCLPYL